MNINGQKVIGYWMSEKKSQKLNWSEFESVCETRKYKLVKIDLNQSLEQQGPFTLILHKLTDIIVLANNGDAKSSEMIQRVEEYLSFHPEVTIIDPLDNVRQLLDRSRSYSIIHDSNLFEKGVFTPTFAEITTNDIPEIKEKLKNSGVHYPFVCKPIVGHGSKEAHKMCIVFNEDSLRDCEPPCVAQSFINHNAILYKIYIVGDQYYVVERPSLKNFYASASKKTIYFDSHDVSKADSQSALSILDAEDVNLETIKPDNERFREIVATLGKAFGMALLGVDVVIENYTGKYAIIDINAYPGYDGFPNFFESLMTCIETIQQHEDGEFLTNSIHKVDTYHSIDTDQDSGFDTGDSSDEKMKLQLQNSKIVSEK